MNDEFDKIMEFFSMGPDEKAHRLEDIFSDSIEFFNKFQYVLENGTDEEKTEVLTKVMKLQEKLQEETEKMCNESGLSEDELRDFANDRENFTDEEWETISKAKSELNEKAEAISHSLPKEKEPGPAEPKKPSAKKKKKKTSKRASGDNWLKS